MTTVVSPWRRIAPQPALWRTATRRRLVVAAAGAATLTSVAYAVATCAGLGGRPGTEALFYATFVLAAAACALRGASVSVGRARWLLIAAAITSWTAGDLYWTFAVSQLADPPYPSLADGLYLLFYPLLAAAVISELRIAHRRERLTSTLDVLAAVMTVAALALIVLDSAFDAAIVGRPAAVATNLAYPVGDALLIAFITARVALVGARRHGPWLWVIAGLGAFVAADALYLHLVAEDAYTVGTPLDALWAVGVALFARAALSVDARRRDAPLRTAGPRTSILCALVATAIETVDHFERARTLTLLLATGVIVVVAARFLVVFADNRRLLAAREADLAAREHDLAHDQLTGLPNRRAFAEALAQELDRATRRGGATGVLMLDVDNFKYVNDTLGHEAGDRLIRAVGLALSQVLRGGDLLARVGGDEFAVLLADCDGARAERCAERLTATLRHAALDSAVPPGHLTASVGVAVVAAGDPCDHQQALARADAAMYDAKDAGRDCYRIHADESSSQALLAERFGWAARIRSALAEDRFELHAQPVVDLRSGEIRTHELLIRLPDGDGGLHAPGAFLPEAERFGLMCALDRWVVTRAVSLAREGSVAVNVSPASVNDPATRAHIIDAVRAAALPSGRLIVEVTEHAALDNMAAARAFAAELRRHGCLLALDDFGVAFASFFHLKQLPFDIIKIDGSFIRTIATEPTDRVLVGAIVDVARRLGKRTVAEHVADDAALEVVRDLGVDFAQGFHLGRPEPAAGALAAVLRAA